MTPTDRPSMPPPTASTERPGRWSDPRRRVLLPIPVGGALALATLALVPLLAARAFGEIVVLVVGGWILSAAASGLAYAALDMVDPARAPRPRRVLADLSTVIGLAAIAVFDGSIVALAVIDPAYHAWFADLTPVGALALAAHGAWVGLLLVIGLAIALAGERRR